MRVLVIEDDRETAQFLQKSLKESGHSADLAGDGETGLVMAKDGGYDILIVDRMLPRLDGLSVVKELRNHGKAAYARAHPARRSARWTHRVKGLRAGGDDYLTKPLRLFGVSGAHRGASRAPCRKSRRRATRSAISCSIAFRIVVTRSGELITLQPREYRLLEYLMKHAGQVVTRTMLLENVWDYHFDPQTNVIDVHVSRLRSKIDKGFDKPLLHTIRARDTWSVTALP